MGTPRLQAWGGCQTISVGVPGEIELHCSKDQSAILGEALACDEIYLFLHKDNNGFVTDQPFVFLVFGNDGYDVINDYSASLEALLEPVNALVDNLEEQYS